MKRHPNHMNRICISAIVLAGYLTLIGCVPSPPAYRFDNGSLNYYLEQSTAIEYPDTETVPLDEVVQQRAPITVSNADFDSFWDLSLEDCVSISLQNTKVVRGFGTPGLANGQVAPGADGIVNGGPNSATLYNVAIRESEPGTILANGQGAVAENLLTNEGLNANQGVEAALAQFDALLTSRIAYGKTDTPSNTTPADPTEPQILDRDQITYTAQIEKLAANGTKYFFRNTTVYTDNNDSFSRAIQPLRFFYQTAFEAEIRQPLLRGRGTFINRMPVVISRIQTDQEIANLDAILQNKVTNIEIRYWDLLCAYRNLETAKTGRDSALDTWRLVNENFKAERVARQEEAESREQYFFFRAQVETAWAALLDAESDLRWLMGIANTDGRLIRPIDEPVKAWVAFDWCEILDEALSYRPELRQERWEIRKRELSLAYSKNSLLPELSVNALYRWLGAGEKLANYDTPAPIFPSANSGSFNELFDGNYQEFDLSVDFFMPVGFRRELANVRNAQLKLAEQIAILEDMELDVARELSQAFRALDMQYEQIQTNFNRWVAATTELEARRERFEAGTDQITFVLDSQRRTTQGEQAFYQALCEYNKLISLIHRRKGTILAYSNVQFAEGPWADKAYHDASEHARRRGASQPIEQRWTRPEVISQGPFYPTTKDGCSSQSGGSCDCGAGCSTGTAVPQPGNVIYSTPNDNLGVPIYSAPPQPSGVFDSVAPSIQPELIPTPPQTNYQPQNQPTVAYSNSEPPIVSGDVYRNQMSAVPPAPQTGQVRRAFNQMANGQSGPRR